MEANGDTAEDINLAVVDDYLDNLTKNNEGTSSPSSSFNSSK